MTTPFPEKLGLSLYVLDGQVAISRGDDVKDLDWSRVQSAFGVSTGALDASGLLLIDSLVFKARVAWFKIWERDGGQVSVDSSLVELFAEIDKESETFEILRTSEPGRYQGVEVEVPDLTKQLKPEQHENILCLLEMPNGSNFSVPGAGKTLTTLALWKILVARAYVNRLLVVCPRSAMGSWRDEARDSFSNQPFVETFVGDPIDGRAEIVLVNYEQLENPEKLRRISAWLGAAESHLVIDEAHRVKAGGRSVRWRACKTLSLKAKRVDLLTGTPMPNGPDDLASLFSLTWPQVAKGTIVRDGYQKLRRKTVFVRTTKDELLLPKLEIQVIASPPSELQGQILDALRDSYSGRFGISVLESKSLARRGKAVMTLLAASTNPGLLVSREFSEIEFGFSWPPAEIEEDQTLSALVRDYLNFETPWKYRKAVELVAEHAGRGEKVIVWSSFVGNLAAAKRFLTKFKPALVFGGTGAEEREVEIARFKTDPNCMVLLSNPQTLGEGISLHQECHTAIYVDRTFNAGQYLQSVDRIHRLGLPKDTETKIYFLQTEDSLDMRVAERLDLKIRALAAFLEDESLTESAIPSSEEVSAEEALGISEEDFAEIMSFLGEQ